MARLSTHVLDTSRGFPGAGISVEVWKDGVLLSVSVTDADGRIAAQEVAAGVYELVFHVADYLRAEPAFFDRIAIQFKVADPSGKYHVPLLLSPYGYSTYRGS